MAKRKIGQQDIAEALGLSRCLVTKVLNHDPVFRVAPETRELVLEKAREMGYDPRRQVYAQHSIPCVRRNDILYL